MIQYTFVHRPRDLARLLVFYKPPLNFLMRPYNTRILRTINAQLVNLFLVLLQFFTLFANSKVIVINNFRPDWNYCCFLRFRLLILEHFHMPHSFIGVNYNLQSCNFTTRLGNSLKIIIIILLDMWPRDFDALVFNGHALFGIDLDTPFAITVEHMYRITSLTGLSGVGLRVLLYVSEIPNGAIHWIFGHFLVFQLKEMQACILPWGRLASHEILNLVKMH